LPEEVLFVHGQPGLGSDFDAVAGLLGPEFHVLSPDRPGYGENKGPPVSIAASAFLLATLIEKSPQRRAIVVGHSYGGAIAILLAARRPDLVTGLVLAASVGSGEHLGALDRLLAAPVVGDVLAAGGLGAAATLLPALRARSGFVPGRLGRWIAVNFPDRSFSRVAPPWTRTWRTVVAEQRMLFAEIESVEESIPLIVVPTEVITGTWDIVVSPSVAASTAASIRGSRLSIVPGVGHFLPRDAAPVIADAVVRVAAKGLS
jgi:pimeloyl-ACP methyl ester carboxylesterase